LRLLIAEQDIRKDMFVTPELEARIIAAAPPSLIIDGRKVPLSYQQGRVTTKISESRVPIDWLANLEDQPQLPDGRPITFRYKDKKYNLLQLRRVLHEEGIL
jgi:hypothetical protein